MAPKVTLIPDWLEISTFFRIQAKDLLIPAEILELFKVLDLGGEPLQSAHLGGFHVRSTLFLAVPVIEGAIKTLESFMNVSFLLIKPENPANVGATARAMKTMGHHDLRLIAPCDYLNERGRALAHASEDLLEAAKVYETYEEATADMDLVIATTARHRRVKFDYIPSYEIMDKIRVKKDLVKNVCFVFGGERDGLATEYLRKADLITTIPTATKFPSLNLSQSVMIFSYLAKSELAVVQTDDWRINENELKESDMSSLKKSVLDLIDDLGMKDPTTIKRQTTHAIAKLGYDDLYLVHNLRKRIAARIASLKALVKE